ncbi:MAG TPA: hypothetical protein VFB38_14910 [Chthonomonadaceae bacterium]|nr:hypothetical protein [Chthonomonadaceae bacterium]
MPPIHRYTSAKPWSQTRPKTLVVACSDGRLQKGIDEFLEQHMGVVDYDRLYTPGGPGALAASGYELLRADQFRREFAFLMQAHGTEEVILIFHGAAEGGPEHATCAHYKRLMPNAPRAEIARQQERDAEEVLRQAFIGLAKVRVHVYRAEVAADNSVRFMDLLLPGMDKGPGIEIGF